VVDGRLETTYGYDVNGNLTTRTPNNSTNCTYTYDALDRVTHIVHALHGTTCTFDYAYDAVGNRKWTKRDGGTGDVFRYDLADQAIGVQLNVSNPDQVQQPIQWTIAYDGNGNRTNFWPYGTSDVYTSNNLSEYTQRTRNGTPTSAVYGNKGNLTSGVDGSTYSHDAQNRLPSATKSGVTETFKYDGLNRQVSRTVGGSTTCNVYDGWNLMGEYASGATSPSAGYVYGAGELVKNVVSGGYYYQDGSGSTSHVTGGGGYLFEWYRYDLQGTPVFYNSSNVQISGSNFGIRHLFTGQQWYSELGLYDLRNRFYSPDIGRFLQPDPIGFWGDRSNLYRYCRNNPVKRRDPSGLGIWDIKPEYGGTVELQPVIVTGTYPDIVKIDVGYPSGPGPGGPGGPGEPGDHVRVTIEGRSPEEYLKYTNSYTGPTPKSNQGPSVVVAAGPPAPPTPLPGLFSLQGLWDLFSGGPSWAPFYEWLDRPPTPDEIKWTNSGFWPTVVLTLPIVPPIVAPESPAALALGLNGMAPYAKWAAPFAAALLRVAEFARDTPPETSLEDEPIPTMEEPVPSGPGTRPANPAGWPTPVPGF
jgi:RHS repeat-associated protein